MASDSVEFPENAIQYWDTFLGLSPKDNVLGKAQVILVPVPYDSTTSYRTGARDGPRAIITASRQLEDYDVEFGAELSDVGIYTSPEVGSVASGPQSMNKVIHRVVRTVAPFGKVIGLIGGEHSITIGAVGALVDLHPDLSVLYLDAHADLRDEYMGTRWGHASVARRIYDLCSVVEVGVRSLSLDEMRFIKKNNVPVLFWPQNCDNIDDVASRVLADLSPNVYISIDLDVMDPSIMPAVGTPEPGGMTWESLIGLLREVSIHRNIVGFDVTELSPDEGPEASTFIAAKLIYKMIGYSVKRNT